MNRVTVRFFKDAWRVAATMIAATLMLWGSSQPLFDEVLGPLLAGSAIVVYIAAFTHILRRVMFPSVDIKEYLDIVKDEQDPIAAAIVVAAFCGVTLGFLTAFTAVMK